MRLCWGLVIGLIVVAIVMIEGQWQKERFLSGADGCRVDWVSNGRYCTLVDSEGNRVTSRAY